LAEMSARYDALRKATLKDLPMQGGKINFWPDEVIS